MEKFCNKCQIEKDVTQFSRNPAKKDGLNYACRKCQSSYFKSYYKNNKKKVIANSKKWDNRNRLICQQEITKHFKNNPCLDCGETDPVVLEFDHVKGKKYKSISLMMGGGYSWRSIKKEIKKCEIRCANCHKRKTARERRYWILQFT